MTEPSEPMPSFNLWTDAWITLEKPQGGTARLSIEETLLNSHEYVAVYETSPLIVVGVHRLLVAILHSALKLQKARDLKTLLKAGQFPAKALRDFGKQHAERFDLFSASAPFLQSADLPLKPDKGSNVKTIAYLTTETPAGTEVMHYRHTVEDAQAFCPACAARGLVIIPCFATSGGAGIKPSINGVPPIYIQPVGKSLFESLTLSLALPEYQPRVASQKSDVVWWVRPSKVNRSKIVREVGYLHSLTFPARRVRLHPERLNAICTRCGQQTEWSVRSMIFEMGESRSKEAAFWFDPFAAYRLPSGKGKTDTPTPLRPREGKALWREFDSLFLMHSEDTKDKTKTQRPSILDQAVDMGLMGSDALLPVRCIGLRTDMKAKVFEWIDASFEVPIALLNDESAGWEVRRATRFATDCAIAIASAFRQAFSDASMKSERHRSFKARMEDRYWAGLAATFRQFVLDLATMKERSALLADWADAVVREARNAFDMAASAVGDDAGALRQQVQGQRLCNMRLAARRKKYLDELSQDEGVNA